MFLFGKASMGTASPETRTRIASLAMWCTHLTWKMLGQPAPKCWFKKQWCWWMCACFDVMRSHGWPAKLPRRCSFFLFDRSAYFFSLSFAFYNAFGLVRFSSYKDHCWAETVIIWIVLLSLHGATRSTRFGNNRASLSAWLSFFLQHVGQHRSKNDHDEEIKSQTFYWSCMYCCER